MTDYKRLPNEDFDTYALRLYDNKSDYDLSAVLDSFIGQEGISLSIGVDDDVPAVTEE